MVDGMPEIRLMNTAAQGIIRTNLDEVVVYLVQKEPRLAMICLVENRRGSITSNNEASGSLKCSRQIQIFMNVGARKQIWRH